MSKTMSVQVKECHLRNKPSFMARIVTSLRYADEVRVEQEEDKWLRVAAVKKQGGGWVHVSALSQKKIIIDPNSADIENAASSDELALAGKGFNEQVEDEYKRKNKDVDFTWIDRMEKIVIAPQEISGFLEKGGLKPEEGGDI